MFNSFDPVSFIFYFLVLIFSIIIHEVSHGFVADKLGDPTARLAGRLTLNPIPHIDPIGSIILPLLLFVTNAGFLFGWAKPVPIDPFNLSNPRKDSALIAFVGPLSNIILALVGAITIRLLPFIDQMQIYTMGYQLCTLIIVVNLSLALFNLVPIYPLDGFKVVGGLLPRDKADEWNDLARYGNILLLLIIFPLINGRSMISFIISPIFSFILPLLIPR